MLDKDMQQIVRLLVDDEGYKQFAYDDLTGKDVTAPVGKLTIGIGINLQDTGIDYDEAVYLLVNRVRKFQLKLAAFPFYKSLDIVRRYVLLNMCFNLGFDGLVKFRKLLACVEVGNYQEAHDEILNSKAARQLPARYGRLAIMMATGKFI